MFTSARERRLWLWASVVVATIYSTLGLARTLAGELRDREMFDTFFVVGFLLVRPDKGVTAFSQAEFAELGSLVCVQSVNEMRASLSLSPRERR